MKISTKGRYGVRALIDLALNSEVGNTTLKVISERQDISERYLEQIFSLLRKAGIIIGRKGAQGGYTLSKSTDEITMKDILIALEGETFLIDINEDSCNEIEKFINDTLWKEINSKVDEYFTSITLERLVNEYKTQKENILYYI